MNQDMDITIEGLNALNYEQTVCFHVMVCGFVAQHQMELQEFGLMEESQIAEYKNNVHNLIPDAFVTPLTIIVNAMVWNLLLAVTENVHCGRNINISKDVADIIFEAWKNVA